MNLPDGFCDNMKSLLGEDASRFFEAMGREPAVGIRLNVRKPVGDPHSLFGEMTPVEWCASGFRIPYRPLFTANPLLHAGVFYVQDPSSMIYETLIGKLISGESGLKDGAPLRVLDLCAAPGGKTTAMINSLPDGSLVVANEFVGKRADVLKENIQKWGYPDVVVTNSPVDRFESCAGFFDIVAVDAPCSGEGMMRKEDIAVTQWSESLVAQCASLQRDILAEAVRLVRPGGYLIYSTCTFNCSENEDKLRFLSEEYGMESVRISFPQEWGVGNGLDDDICSFRFMPHLTDGEGLFVGVMRKPEGDSEGSSRSYSTRAGRSRGGKEKGKEMIVPDISSWTIEPSGERISVVPLGDRLSIVSDNVKDFLDHRSSGLRVILAGTEAAVLKGREWVPVSELALSTVFNKDAFPVVELSEEDARCYLRREAIALPAGTPKGYVAVAFHGYPLGMVKNLGNRANNLYPALWRVRKVFNE